MKRGFIRFVGTFVAAFGAIGVHRDVVAGCAVNSLTCSNGYNAACGSIYKCSSRAISGDCAIVNTNTTFADTIRSDFGSRAPGGAVFMYLTPTQTTGISWCNGGNVFIAISGSGTIPGWDMGNIVADAQNISICCSQGLSGYAGSATGAVWHVPNIEFLGCTSGRLHACSGVMDVNVQRLCVDKVSGEVNARFAGALADCCNAYCSGCDIEQSNLTPGIDWRYGTVTTGVAGGYNYSPIDTCVMRGNVGDNYGSDDSGTFVINSPVCTYQAPLTMGTGAGPDDPTGTGVTPGTGTGY